MATSGLARRREGLVSMGHAGQRQGAVLEHPPRDGVETGHVADRVEHDDVFGADERLGHARGHGRDQDLGQAEREGAHDRRAESAAAGAARRDDAAQAHALVQLVSERDRPLDHERHALALVVEGADLGHGRAHGRRDLVGGDVGAALDRAADAGVQEVDLQPVLFEAFPDEPGLDLFGIQRSDQQYSRLLTHVFPQSFHRRARLRPWLSLPLSRRSSSCRPRERTSFSPRALLLLDDLLHVIEQTGLLLHEMGPQFPSHEALVRHDRLVEGDVGLDAR